MFYAPRPGRQSGFNAIVFVAALALCPSVRAEEKAPRCPNKEDPCCQGWSLVDAYARLYDAESSEPSSFAPPGEPARSSGHFRHLVVTVPDPVESGHTDYFDSVLEGVEEAIAHGTGVSGYVRDNSWLPWSATDDATKKLRCWEREPGVVLYRAVAASNAVEPGIVVLLVGETPTWGLRPAVFREALNVVRSFGAWEPELGEVPYQVLGPTFSGTARSLAGAIDEERSEAQEPPAKFVIASGTATSTDVPKTLALAQRSNDSYWAATPDDEQLLAALCQFLRARGGTPRNTVLFTEALTAYGSTAKSAKDTSAGRSDTSCFIEWKFPPNLHSIREAYQAGQAAGSVPARAPAGTGARDEDHGEFSDQTPVNHDLELGDVLGKLSAGKVRFAGIVATDARDVVFLAGRIRGQLPDVRLFTLGAEIEYVNPSNADVMNGTLVAHSTPMSDDEAGGQYASTSLEDEMVQNAFLAGRYLVDREHPRPTPRVRVSLIGNGSFWQIGPDPEPNQGESSGATRARVPMSWQFSSWFFIFALVGAFVVMLPSWLGDFAIDRGLVPQRSEFARRRGRLWLVLGSPRHTDLKADDRFVTAAILTVAACAPAIMLLAQRVAEHAPDPADFVGRWLSPLAFVWGWALLAGARADRFTVGLTLLASVASLLAVALGDGPARAVVVNLMSGGSPVMASLAGFGTFTVALWCWHGRLRFLDGHRFGVVAADGRFDDSPPPIATALGESEGKKGAIYVAESRVLGAIRNPWTKFSVVPVGVHAALFATALVFLEKPPQTFESGERHWLVLIFGGLALLPVTGNFARLLAMWFRFASFLRRLAAVPVLDGLARLPSELARPLEAQLTVSSARFSDFSYPVRALGALAALRADLADDAKKAERLLREEFLYQAGSVGEGEGNADARVGLVNLLLDTSAEVTKSSAASDAERVAAQDFVSSVVAVFIPQYVRQFRLFAPPLVVGSVLATLMTSLYFVEPERLITSVIFVWVAAIVLAIFFVYIALDRDPVMSAMSKTPAGTVSFSWGLVRRIVSWGLVPLGSLVASQYPGFATHVSSVFDVVSKGFR